MRSKNESFLFIGRDFRNYWNFFPNNLIAGNKKSVKNPNKIAACNAGKEVVPMVETLLKPFTAYVRGRKCAKICKDLGMNSMGYTTPLAKTITKRGRFSSV